MIDDAPDLEIEFEEQQRYAEVCRLADELFARDAGAAEDLAWRLVGMLVERAPSTIELGELSETLDAFVELADARADKLG